MTRRLEDQAYRLGVRTIYLLATTAAECFPKLGFHVVQRAEVPDVIAAAEEFNSSCPASAICSGVSLGVCDSLSNTINLLKEDLRP